MSGSRKARGAGGLSSGDLRDWRRRPRCVGKADLVIRSSHARLGVLLSAPPLPNMGGYNVRPIWLKTLPGGGNAHGRTPDGGFGRTPDTRFSPCAPQIAILPPLKRIRGKSGPAAPHRPIYPRPQGTKRADFFLRFLGTRGDLWAFDLHPAAGPANQAQAGAQGAVRSVKDAKIGTPSKCWQTMSASPLGPLVLLQDARTC